MVEGKQARARAVRREVAQPGEGGQAVVCFPPTAPLEYSGSIVDGTCYFLNIYVKSIYL
jgi:hypothetical protein